jgi:hypothetical protein
VESDIVVVDELDVHSRWPEYQYCLNEINEGDGGFRFRMTVGRDLLLEPVRQNILDDCVVRLLVSLGIALEVMVLTSSKIILYA